MSRALSMIATGSRRTLATIGGLALGLGIFMLLPVLESITSTPTEELQVQDADTIAPPPPPREIEQEEEKPEEQPPEQEPPKLADEAPPLDLSQLELALNPGTGGAGGFGGDFTVNLGTAIKQASETTEEADGLFSVGDLDQKPRVIAQSSPVVPAALKKLQSDNVTVQVIFVVNQQGRVEEPKVRRSNNSAFDQVAINCVKSWKFEPGKRNGESVRFRMMAPITFPKKK
ncbi:MAG: energy transducer TonB [Bacteroidia bacterium]|jgi:protein TonB|nr:energy transducer TonB [Bacteroidia bacterium]